MIRLIVKRLLILPVSLFVLITLSFFLIKLMPGNPAVTIAGNFASHEEVQRISRQLGLNHSMWYQYTHYIWNAIHGNLGSSYFSGTSVMSELGRRIPATVELVALSLVVASVIGIGMGVLGSYFRGSWADRLTRGWIMLFQSTPDFLLALVLIYSLFYVARLTPAPVGQLGLTQDSVKQVSGFLLIDTLLGGRADLFWQAATHLVMPVLALGIVYSAMLGKVTRSAMDSVMNTPQVEYARACGLPEWRVVHFGFLEARTTILTYVAILFGSLVGGASIVETVFSWQGAGQWALEAILKLDVPVIQGFILAAGVITIVLYLLLDVVVLLLDPRVRY